MRVYGVGKRRSGAGSDVDSLADVRVTSWRQLARVDYSVFQRQQHIRHVVRLFDFLFRLERGAKVSPGKYRHSQYKNF